jgi:hypothetical protein
LKQKRSLKEAVMCLRKRTDEVAVVASAAAAAAAAAPPSSSPLRLSPSAAQEHSLSSVSQLYCFELASSSLK